MGKKQQKVPKALQIGSSVYKIEHVDLEDKESHGELESLEYVIRVNKLKYPAWSDRFEQTLFHEVLHAALEQLGWDEYLKDSKDEMLVKGLEHILFPLVQFRKEVL